MAVVFLLLLLTATLANCVMLFLFNSQIIFCLMRKGWFRTWTHEAAGVVVAHGLGISESLQEGVGLQDDVFHMLHVAGRD